MRETPLYQGEQFRAADVPVARVPEIQLPVQSGAAIDRAVGVMADGLHRYAQIKDFQKGQEAERTRRANGQEFEAELERRANLAWGSEGSLFHADGTVNDDVRKALVQEYQQRNLAATPEFWLTENRVRGHEAAADANTALELGSVSMLGRREIANMETAFRDNFDLAVAQGDFTAAANAASEAAKAGLITPQRAEVMRLGLAKRATARRVAASRGSRAAAVELGVDALAALQGEMPADGRADAPEDAAGTQGVPLTMLPVDAPQPQGLTYQVPEVGAETPEPLRLTPTGVQNPVPTLDSLMMQGAAEGVDPFELPGMVGVGVQAMSDDEVGQMLTETTTFAGQVEMVPVDFSPASVRLPQSNPDTDEAMAAHVSVVRQEGGFTQESYRAAVWATGMALLNDPDTSRLTPEHAKKEFLARVTIPGLEDDIFGGDAAAMTSMLDGVFEDLWATRDAEISSRVRSLVEGGKEGLPGTKGILTPQVEAQILARFQPEKAVRNLSSLDIGFFDSLSTRRGKFEPSYALYWRYREQFLQDTGLAAEVHEAESSGKQASGAEISSRDTMEAFRDWFFKSGGAYDKMREDYLRSVRELCVQRATEAVARRRQTSGEVNWAEEQKLIAQTVESTVSNLDGRDPWGSYRQGREETMRQRARAIRAAYEEHARPQIEAERARRREAQWEQWDAEAAREAKKKDAEKAEKAHATRFTRTMTAGMHFDKDADNKEPTIFVPEEWYPEILAQLGSQGGEGIVCSVNGQSNYLVVKPAKQKGMTYNQAAFNRIYSAQRRKSMTKAQYRRALRGAPHKVKFCLF